MALTISTDPLIDMHIPQPLLDVRIWKPYAYNPTHLLTIRRQKASTRIAVSFPILLFVK